MSPQVSLARRARRAALSAAFGAALSTAALLGATAPSAAEESYFFGLITPTPMVHVALSGTASEAQLISTLEAQGFTDIKVTPLSPNQFDPRPELLHVDLTVSSPSDPRAQTTPIHDGWNGTAVRDGRTFHVYVDSPEH
jgi:hypothetical protein